MASFWSNQESSWLNEKQLKYFIIDEYNFYKANILNFW